jgi:hypothetical protein
MSSPKTFDYQKAQLENWDFVVLAVYFISVLCVGIWVSLFYFILEMPLKIYCDFFCKFDMPKTLK